MSTKPPKTVEQATELLGRYAELDARLARSEAQRKAEIGRINAAADVEATPLLAELEAIAARLQPWWAAAAPALGKGRKSIQLGGCMVGSRSAAAKLAHGFESDDKAVDALRGSRFGKHTVLTKYSLDRAATLKLLQVGGKTGKTLGELGFSILEGSETFFVKPVEQAGTIAAAAA